MYAERSQLLLPVQSVLSERKTKYYWDLRLEDFPETIIGKLRKQRKAQYLEKAAGFNKGVEAGKWPWSDAEVETFKRYNERATAFNCVSRGYWSVSFCTKVWRLINIWVPSCSFGQVCFADPYLSVSITSGFYFFYSLLLTQPWQGKEPVTWTRHWSLPPHHPKAHSQMRPFSYLPTENTPPTLHWTGWNSWYSHTRAGFYRTTQVSVCRESK